MHDMLTSLCGVVEHLPTDTRFIVPRELAPYHVDSLAMLGIGADRLVPFDISDVEESPRAWKLERLWFSPGPTGPTASPAALAWLRDAGIASLDAAPEPPHRLLYLSRRRTRYRQVVNEDEVAARLVDLGFEVHTPEDYTLRDQIALFAEAKVVVGAHGAAHANMVFSPPGLVLVAIHCSDVDKFFHNMSLALGHEYWYMLGEDVPNGTDINPDIFVPMDKLERITSLALTSAHGRR
jgi:capsular polysaccharide biosynthesis protein